MVTLPGHHGVRMILLVFYKLILRALEFICDVFRMSSTTEIPSFPCERPT
jgi:hypothetical protein